MKIAYGTFDAESLWRPMELARLPQTGEGASSIVNAMDELLFAFAGDKDLLYTRHPFSSSLKDYLSTCGFSFQNAVGEGVETLRSFMQAAQDVRTVPYAITEQWQVDLGAETKYPLPALDAVKRVNSKEFSAELADALCCNGFKSVVVHSLEDLKKYGEHHTEEFLIKDLYGVSGKGMLAVNRPRLLERLISHLRKQVQAGKEIAFVCEPRVDKDQDFSTHYLLFPDGSYQFLSLQKTLNRSFLYKGSHEGDAEMVDLLEKRGYFDIMRSVMASLHQYGYHGEVGIDSMTTKDGALVPLVEINARQSMGLIHHALRKRLLDAGGAGSDILSCYDMGLTADKDENWLFELLEKSDLLYGKEKGIGIMPISMNTLLANRHSTYEQVYRGRLYFLSVDNTHTEALQGTERFKELLKENGVTVYG